MIRLKNSLYNIIRYHSKKNTSKNDLIKDISNILSRNINANSIFFSHSKYLFKNKKNKMNNKYNINKNPDLHGHVDRY